MCFRASLAAERDIVSFFHEKQCSEECEMLEDTEWLSDFAFFTDLLCHMNNLNVKMQGKNQFIDDIWAHLKAFKLKLNLFAGQLAKNDLSHFSRLNSIPSVNEEKLKNYEDGLKKLHFEFERRFQDFSAIQTELDIFTMPFNVNCEAVRSDLQLELIELQSNNHLKQSFLNMPKLEFYKSLSKSIVIAILEGILVMAQKRKRSQDASGKKPAPSTRAGTRAETQTKRPKQPVRAVKEKKKTVKNAAPPAVARDQNAKQAPNARSSGEGRSVRVDPGSSTAGRNDAPPPAFAQDPSAKQVPHTSSSGKGQLEWETVREYECSICLDTSDNTRMKYLPCFHKFHTACINTWLDVHRICPICRTFVRMFVERAPSNYQYQPVKQS
ncbi:General transcription factor II-I repeat domain-containing protein 2 [Araneus ventricosus]|uniref:General transcription factor II-I repeat domain-containing protein 2 n=1 Tax=Araneus ventricosus TaxID=182803 RepID=A0A4Y2KNC3_ARAVE|nr:General transcription factor II-I repeat domain-containing protein 2 [Araneus ventricosus]